MTNSEQRLDYVARITWAERLESMIGRSHRQTMSAMQDTVSCIQTPETRRWNEYLVAVGYDAAAFSDRQSLLRHYEEFRTNNLGRIVLELYNHDGSRSHEQRGAIVYSVNDAGVRRFSEMMSRNLEHVEWVRVGDSFDQEYSMPCASDFISARPPRRQRHRPAN